MTQKQELGRSESIRQDYLSLRDRLDYEISTHGNFEVMEYNSKFTPITCHGLIFTFLIDHRAKVAKQVNGAVDLELGDTEEKDLYNILNK